MSHPWALLATAVLGVGTLLYVAVTMFNQNQPHGHGHRGRRGSGGSGTSNRTHSWYTRSEEDEEEADRKKSKKSKSTGQQQQKEDNVPKCSICLESFDDLVNGGHSLCMISQCSHVFCEKCIKASLRRTASCPKCRNPATIENLTFIYL